MENTNQNQQNEQTLGPADQQSIAPQEPVKQEEIDNNMSSPVMGQSEQPQDVGVQTQQSADQQNNNYLPPQPPAPMQQQAVPVANGMMPNQPYTQQPQMVQQPMTESQSSTNPMHLILQWVTYVLWGWAVLVLSVLIFSLVNSFTSGNDVSEFLLYPLSALLILLPASVIVDTYYRRVEPLTKKGGALAIMVIHAVIYVIFMIGFLIAAVFSVVGMMLNEGSSSSVGNLISSLIVAVCYALLLTRTLKPSIFIR
jgi:hypothetical protein